MSEASLPLRSAFAGLLQSAPRRLDRWILKLGSTRHRLIGLSLLRIALAVAAVMFYASDFWDRYFLWGPRAYDSLHDAHSTLSHGLFSFYLWAGHSFFLFNALYILGILAAVAFGIFGTKPLTLLHAVMLWSIYNRNQDILEGGDNLARIALIFLCFCTCNAYLSPLASRTRRRLQTQARGTVLRYQVGSALHNVGAFLIVFQVCVVYLVAGYFKITATVWNDGVAMYYVSRIHEFQMFGFYPALFKSAYLSQLVSWCTIIFELAVPFVVVSRRAWRRKLVTFGLEGMHLGIMLFMGLVAFGLIFIGADSALLRDSDYRDLRVLCSRAARAAAEIFGRRYPSNAVGTR